jgi:hypothetical protein
MIDQFLTLFFQTTPLQWLVAFLILTVTDVCWAKYTKNTAGDNAVSAANWAVCLFLLGGLAVVGYTTNPVLLIPSAIGGWVGTYIGVKVIK